jgi:hypothetical protein
MMIESFVHWKMCDVVIGLLNVQRTPLALVLEAQHLNLTLVHVGDYQRGRRQSRGKVRDQVPLVLWR